MRLLCEVILLLNFATCACAQAAPAHPPFAINIAPATTDLKVGDAVDVLLSVTNLTNGPIDLSANISDLTGIDPNFIWSVTDDRGSAVSKRTYPHAELAGGRPFFNTLEPGATFTEKEPLGRLFDMSKPGKYVIEASRQVSLSNSSAGSVKSNKITVTITGESTK